MSKHLGDYDVSTVIYTDFSTYQPSTGAIFTLAGSPAIAVYKDNSTTESTAGVTLTPSFDSRTGLNHLAIDTSSDGTFYSAGSFFDAVLTAGTVDSVSVAGSAIASFTIRKDSALKPTTAGRTLATDTSGRAAIESNTVTNVALNNFEFVMVDSTGAPRTGLTVVAQRSIDGGAISSCANSVTEVSNGIYKINLATSDLNGAVITLRFTATGAQDRLITVITTP